jgi:hypothetical protein
MLPHTSSLTNNNNTNQKKTTISTQIVYPLEDRIFKLLEQHPEGLTEYGIATILIEDRDTIRRKLTNLTKDKKTVGFTFKKQIKYFIPNKNFARHIINHSKELYPNQRTISLELFEKIFNNKSDDKLKEILVKFGLKCGSLESNSFTLTKAKNIIDEMFEIIK